MPQLCQTLPVPRVALLADQVTGGDYARENISNGISRNAVEVNGKDDFSYKLLGLFHLLRPSAFSMRPRPAAIEVTSMLVRPRQIGSG